MIIEKIPEKMLTNNLRYLDILREKINELIDEIDYWKKAHIQLQDQHIRLQNEVYKSSKPSLAKKSDDFLHQKGNSSSKKDCYYKKKCDYRFNNKCHWKYIRQCKKRIRSPS